MLRRRGSARHDRMLQTDIVQQPLYHRILLRGAARRDRPVAVWMRVDGVNPDRPHHRPPTPPLPAMGAQQSGKKDLLEIMGRHAPCHAGFARRDPDPMMAMICLMTPTGLEPCFRRETGKSFVFNIFPRRADLPTQYVSIC